jgi:hypothetical protein
MLTKVLWVTSILAGVVVAQNNTSTLTVPAFVDLNEKGMYSPGHVPKLVPIFYDVSDLTMLFSSVVSGADQHVSLAMWRETIC